MKIKIIKTHLFEKYGKTFYAALYNTEETGDFKMVYQVDARKETVVNNTVYAIDLIRIIDKIMSKGKDSSYDSIYNQIMHITNRTLEREI